MLEGYILIQRGADDLLGLGGAFAALITTAQLAPQGPHIAHTAFGYGTANLTVGNFLADANVHGPSRKVDSALIIIGVRIIINSLRIAGSRRCPPEWATSGQHCACR